jgi:hydroxyacylglutathione hydrolase
MKRLFVFLFIIMAALNQALCQQSSPWFSVKELYPKIWRIGDHGSDNMYVVEGKDSAMLIDAGLGVADLATQVKKLTSKPLIVVITHGHPDHAGSDYQFEKVYIHPADSAAARAYNKPEARSGSSSAMAGADKPSPEELYKGKVFNTRMIPVNEGRVFDLGGKKIQIIETPGHTPGEIVLLDVQDKLLFTGDNNNGLVWLFLNNCLPLHKYLATLQKEAGRMSEFTTLLPGHGDPIPADFINDQISCVKGILDGSLERKPYKSFAGDAMVSVFGRASVTFNPSNL